MRAVSKKDTIITSIFAFQLASRGADYICGNPKPGMGAFELGEYTPAMVWGITCLIVAALVTAALVAQAPRVLRVGQIIAMCVYLAFSVLVVDDVVRGGLDDWRFFTGYLAAAAMWGVMAGSLTIRIAIMDSREGDGGVERPNRATRNN